MNRVGYFEMPVEDMKRATKFYENVFGWTITEEKRESGSYYSAKTGRGNSPGINGSFYKKEPGWESVINIVYVDDIDTALKKITDLGGKITFAKCVINGVGYLAYFEDPHGNAFGMMQSDPDVWEDGGR